MSSVSGLSKPSKDYPETIDPQAVLDELQFVHEQLADSEKASEYIAPVETRRKLQELEHERTSWEVAASVFGTAFIGSMALSIVGLLGLALAWKPLTRIQKLSRLIKLIETLLEAFEDLGVEALPLIRVPDLQPIDLFVRFPGKEFLLFAVRSFGESTIVYNESKQALYYKRGRKGSKRWEPDPMQELSDQAYWLRKNRRELFGSSKGVRKPMAKVVVIWGKTQLDQHRDHLYAKVGDQKFLFIPRERGACYVIHQSQVVEFTRAYLVERQSKLLVNN
ncbi:MAG: hypothetical protein F6J95_020635 [Leptolyngbya sp. SIO1E4]|nr:hypothetical protein [Leptolyngbya sp. SIO1E4]